MHNNKILPSPTPSSLGLLKVERPVRERGSLSQTQKQTLGLHIHSPLILGEEGNTSNGLELRIRIVVSGVSQEHGDRRGPGPLQCPPSLISHRGCASKVSENLPNHRRWLLRKRERCTAYLASVHGTRAVEMPGKRRVEIRREVKGAVSLQRRMMCKTALRTNMACRWVD